MGLESHTSAECRCPWDNIVRLEAFANSDAWTKCNGSPKAKNQSYPRCETVGPTSPRAHVMVLLAIHEQEEKAKIAHHSPAPFY